MSKVIDNNRVNSMEKIVAEHENMIITPEVGDTVNGTIIDKARNAIYVDLAYLGVGVIYGKDLFDSSSDDEYGIGDNIEAKVEKYDNEDDLIELSLRAAAKEKSWNELRRKLKEGEIFETELLEANKGGVIVKINGVTGFLPVSQLAPDNYPRVEGGDKSKILDRLNELVGKKLNVKVICAEEGTEKLIVSEKSAISDEMTELLGKIKVGEVVSGTVSGIVDFGVFIKFIIEENEFEGLVHISELAWQRIDDPSEYVQVGDHVDAKVIGVDGLRISLSIKQMQNDPWKGVAAKYKVGDIVDGEIIKVTPFGGFIKLDDDIHGLVHVSELPSKMQGDPAEYLKVGTRKSFKIISLQPDDHRLGLSLSKVKS